MQEMVHDIREQVETEIKKEKDEDSWRNEEDRMKRKKEDDTEWRERKSRRDQTKILKPVPKAVLMRSARKDKVKQQDAERKSRLNDLLNKLKVQEPKKKKRLRLRIQVGIDTIDDIGVDGECMYGILFSTVSACCTPKHCGHNVCCRLHGTTRMSWLNDILHEELLEKPWRWISRPIGYYPYKMLRNRSVKLVFQLSS